MSPKRDTMIATQVTITLIQNRNTNFLKPTFKTNPGFNRSLLLRNSNVHKSLWQTLYIYTIEKVAGQKT